MQYSLQNKQIYNQQYTQQTNFQTANKPPNSKIENPKYQQSPLPKPDLSPITQKEVTFSLKCHGSYKKPKRIYPESPMKSPIQKYFTPIKIEGKNLFGTDGKKPFPFRKLTFDVEENPPEQPRKKFADLLDNVDERDEEICSPDSGNKNENNPQLEPQGSFNCFQLIPNEGNKANNSESDKNQFIVNHKLDKEFSIVKTLSENKFDSVYKCIKTSTNEVFALKKTYKTSIKNNIFTTKNIFDDFNAQFSPQKKFCIKYLDFWIEEEVYEIVSESKHYTDKNLYILYNYYPNGDLLDYLSHLEQNNFHFTPEFYWDIIFEMMCGVNFFHECGYLHLDIKPANFLIDKEGYVLLSDFGLSHKITELKNLDDIFEGDSTYISPEVFNRKSLKDVDKMCDVYSLGLSILEIMAKVELPKNGPLWRAMRTYQLETMPQEFLVNWNIKSIDQFLKLIRKMIAPYNTRKSIIEILHDPEFPELNNRLKKLMEGTYGKSSSIMTVKEELIKNMKQNNEMVVDSPRGC